MRAGSIWAHKDFVCSNGSVLEKKYVIILNTPHDNAVPYFICLATSQGRRKPQSPGCHAERGYFIIVGGQEWFPVKTWLVLNKLYEKRYDYFLKKRFEDGVLEEVSELSPKTIKAIIKCIQACKDVTKYQRDIIREC